MRFETRDELLLSSFIQFPPIFYSTLSAIYSDVLPPKHLCIEIL
jgi:hypothetical protein